MARTIRTKIYKFSELSTDAKLKAVDWLRQHNWEYGYACADEGHGSLRKFCEKFGLKWRSSDFSTNASADVRDSEIDDNILKLSGVRLRTYLLNNYYSLLFERKSYGEYTKHESGKWRYKRYSNCQYKETCCPFTGVCFDETLLQPIREFIKKPTGSDFQDLLNDCIQAWVKDVSNDCEAQDGYEYLAEQMEANDYEFLKDGTKY